MADINVGNNANLLKGAIDSHDTQINNTDNRVDNSVTNNTTNNVVNNTTSNSTIYQAQKTMAQQHAENVQTFVDEVIRLVNAPETTNAAGMLTADAFHHLSMLRLRLMLSQQEADGIISQVQQSLLMTRQQKQAEQAALQREQAAKQMASMAPPMPSMPTPPPMPQFDAQSVQLNQMQGWNPLQAAQQMGLGMSGMPQMPGMSTPPPMPQGMPAMTSMPQTGIPQMPSKSAEAELVIPEQPQPVQQERVPQYGILMTDSLALAEKYGCDVQTVYDVLNELIQNAAQAEQHWYLLDMGNYRQLLGSEPYWGDYNEILSSFIYENGFQVGLATPVFIIGGSDVIPVPPLEDPQYSGSRIPTDMAYCFSTTFFSELWDGDHTITTDYVRNTVSRLPLECGQMQTTIQDDLLSYFNLCSIVEDGIDVPGVTMASNVEWTNNSVTMSQHLPLIHVRTTDEEEIHKGMYMCPKLVATESGGEEVDEKVLNDYQKALDKAGMILFNLHGSDGKGQSGFYCNSDNGYPESFNIELMKQSNARVLNTVACFGARYDGYERDDSMLMSALLGGGKLLYAGSTVSVPMIGDEDQEYPAGVPQYPGSGSEKFMPLYCYYQFCGLPAGQAMMQAKLDYFNTFRHIERDDFSLSTAMMFGLYGNPMLHVCARQDVIDEAMRYEVLPQLPATKTANAPIRMKRTKCLITKEQLQTSKSLIDQLRGCVDGNLQVIHGMVQQNLYQQLGLDPRWLDHVDMFAIGEETGYAYHYDSNNRFGRKSMIEVNNQGQVTRKVTFK